MPKYQYVGIFSMVLIFAGDWKRQEKILLLGHKWIARILVWELGFIVKLFKDKISKFSHPLILQFLPFQSRREDVLSPNCRKFHLQ
jgi:hypothetical protein